MVPSLKNSFRLLIHSLLPKSATKDSLGAGAGNTAVPVSNVSVAIIIWVELLMAILRPWNSESKEVWQDLLGYRIDKAYLCKNRSDSEHEFITVDLSNQQKQSLCLRLERAVSELMDDRPTSASTSTTSFESDSNASRLPSRSISPTLYQRRSSKSSSFISSMNAGSLKATNPLQHTVRRLSDSSLLRPLGISSNRHVAADTVTRIDGFPEKTKVLRNIDFGSAERPQRPSLWDLMILINVIHQDSTARELSDRQCFWFADTVLAILEKWLERCKGVAVKQTKNTTRAYFLKFNMDVYASSARMKYDLVHPRNSKGIDQIWAQFLTQREEMNKKSYEDTKSEEDRKTEGLAGQVEELRRQQAQERRKWECERREQEERERRLVKEQEEREHQLRRQIVEQEQEEREHQLRRQIVEQERLQQRLQQQLLKNDRRF